MAESDLSPRTQTVWSENSLIGEAATGEAAVSRRGENWLGCRFARD
jgi:hypothetical protein